LPAAVANPWYLVEGFVECLECRRRRIEQVGDSAGTEYLEFPEKMVGLLSEQVRPAR
jgi:hypothetical protein